MGHSESSCVCGGGGVQGQTCGLWHVVWAGAWARDVLRGRPPSHVCLPVCWCRSPFGRERAEEYRTHVCELRLAASTADREVEGERVTIDVSGVQIHQESLTKWRAHVQRCHQDAERLLVFFKVGSTRV